MSEVSFGEQEAHWQEETFKINVSMIELRPPLMISADLINARSLHGRLIVVSAKSFLPTLESIVCVLISLNDRT